MHNESHSDQSQMHEALPSPRKLGRLALVVSVIAIGVVVAGISIRAHKSSEVKQWTD